MKKKINFYVLPRIVGGNIVSKDRCDLYTKAKNLGYLEFYQVSGKIPGRKVKELGLLLERENPLFFEKGKLPFDLIITLHQGYVSPSQ